MRTVLAVSAAMLFLSGSSVLAGPTSRPDALPSAESAARAASEHLEKGMTVGAAVLFSDAEGLAIDRGDSKNPQVVAYVGPSWVVSVIAASDQPTPLPLVLDRGTGRLVARAHEVVPMPKKRVYYLDEWQLPAATLEAGDVYGVGWAGSTWTLQLDIGQGMAANLTISAGNRAAAQPGGVRITFAGLPGKMIGRQSGTYAHIQAFTDNGDWMASAAAAKGGAKLEQRVKEILAGLSPRPDETRIWPADSRPRLSGVDGWTTTPYDSGGVGLWQLRNPAEAQPAHVMYVANLQTYAAAKVLHPYDMPPSSLVGGLAQAKIISTRPMELNGWVGVEKEVEVQGPAQAQPYGVIRPQQQAKTIACRARVLDLRRDVRRLLIRLQAPAEQYGGHSAAFERMLSGLRVSETLLEPIIVPLDPVNYRQRK